mmetsp:Transcript_41620/g.63043  ORF Transcript_41620/g.63043 Transcript_41620/m.63043 type:complete len:111 (-) Transcript_41620:49-381(-)
MTNGLNDRKQSNFTINDTDEVTIVGTTTSIPPRIDLEHVSFSFHLQEKHDVNNTVSSDDNDNTREMHQSKTKQRGSHNDQYELWSSFGRSRRGMEVCDLCVSRVIYQTNA